MIDSCLQSWTRTIPSRSRSRSAGDRDANQNRISVQIDEGRRLEKEFNSFDEIRTKLSLAASVLGPNGGLKVSAHVPQPHR